MSQVPPSSGSPYVPSGSPFDSTPYGQPAQGANPYGGPSAASAPGAYPGADQGGYSSSYSSYAQQPSAYGAPAYSSVPAYGAPGGYGAGPALQVRSTTAPAVLLGIGLVVLVGAIVGFVVALTSVLNVNGSLSEIPGNGSVTATLETSTVYGIYSDGLVTCLVNDPQGNQVDVIPVSSSEAPEINDSPLVGLITPSTSGDYTITCTSGSTKPVYLGRAVDGEAVLGTGVGVVGAILLGLPGLALSIAGFIWLGVRRSQNKQARAAAGGYPGAQF